MERKSILERAFELAKGGDCHTMNDIRRALVAEQHSNIEGHLGSRSLRKQLLLLMAGHQPS